MKKDRKIIGKKAFKLLETMEKEQFRKLRKAFQSPYFATNVRLLRLYDHLKKHYPEFPREKLSKEKLFEKLYPGKPYNANLLRVLLREFTEVVEKYLITERVLQDAYLSKWYLTKEFGDRNLHKEFTQSTKLLLAQLEQGKWQDADYFGQVVDLNTDYFFHPLTDKYTLKDDALLSIMDSIDKRFVLQKLQIWSELLNREKIIARKYTIQFSDAILEFGRMGDLKRNLIFQLYHLMIRLLQSENNHTIFNEFKDQFCTNIDFIRPKDKMLLLIPLMNYAVQQINNGNEVYYHEAFDIYNLALEKDMVIVNQKIHEGVFSNIVAIACHAKAFNWTSKFIQDFQRYLDEPIREDMVALNMGLMYFHQQKFNEAYHLMYNHSFSNFYKSKAKLQLLMVLFEQFLLDDTLFELLIYQLDAFEKKLQRDKMLSKEKKEVFSNFMLILRRMVYGIYEKKDIVKLKKSLEEQLDQKGKIVSKRWLTMKIVQL